ncbi:lipid-A-disaccharide synthase [Oecophyllibacter saccharovorans]|nr:lipid-A-disaccharide synthase [Oecophyllibacter saccharovorans]TPW34929.1 lipid-A-disaccharide synthase [Oecophyllibacter saccharovorans]
MGVHMAPVQGQVPLHYRGRVVWILAGEPSGDVIGARLMQALHKLDPMLVFAGVGGGRMEALGLHSLFPMSDLSVMGLTEVLPRLPLLSQRLLQAEQDIALRRPDVVITIDSPGFAMRLLERITPLKVRRLHYVAPQVWAWQERRLKKYRGMWDKLLCLFPFEPEWFAKRGFATEFVGHPVLQAGVTEGNGERFRKRHDIAPDVPILILMPGSRKTEVPRLMPVFEKMVNRLRRRFPDLCVVMPVPPACADQVHRLVKRWKVAPHLITDIEDKHDAFAAAQAAVTKSGTSTLELAMGRVPMVVTYKVNPLSGFLARRMLTVPYVSMINLLANREIVPELLQEHCTPEKLADQVTTLLTDPLAADAQRGAFGAVLEQLQAQEGQSPSDSAAQAVMKLMETPLTELRADLKPREREMLESREKERQSCLAPLATRLEQEGLTTSSADRADLTNPPLSVSSGREAEPAKDHSADLPLKVEEKPEGGKHPS